MRTEPGAAVYPEIPLALEVTATGPDLQEAELDAGTRSDGLTSDDRAEVAEVRRENRRLQQDVDILKRATAFFALLP